MVVSSATVAIRSSDVDCTLVERPFEPVKANGPLLAVEIPLDRKAAGPLKVNADDKATAAAKAAVANA